MSGIQHSLGYRDRTLTLPVHLVHAPSFWSSPSSSFTANIMDTTITKDDNSKTFRGHLKVFIKVGMFLFYQNVAYCVLLKRNAL